MISRYLAPLALLTAIGLGAPAMAQSSPPGGAGGAVAPLSPDSVRTPWGTMHLPGSSSAGRTIMASPGAAMAAAATPPAGSGDAQTNDGVVQVGWMAVPKSTHFDWRTGTLTCRGRRLVTYADIQFTGLNLEQEGWNIARACGERTIRQYPGGIKALIAAILANPEATTATFAASFASCAAPEVGDKITAYGLRFQEEPEGDWGKC